MNIDLRQYVVKKWSWGPWLEDKELFMPHELRLTSPYDDGVTLIGPLRVRVAVQARSTVLAPSETELQARDIYSYLLDIPPGGRWTYPAPHAGWAVDRVLIEPSAESEKENARTAFSAESVVVPPELRSFLWGTNAGFGIAIRPAGSDLCADPCAPDPCHPVDPCAPKKKKCHCGGGCGSGCGCGCEGHGDELPCDFATRSGTHLGTFFPAACEPCAPGAFIGMPPVKGPSLPVPAARGGTVRTRYFNGMFITKEDLWTDQNNNRIKHALMNRAMGQGVVWGFGLSRDGDAICVLPGYGVDCCGNDIVLSSAYRVDAQALLRDPAAAATLAKGGAHRMHLLLEYFECPEEPRPVHGDPCSPETMCCEMSRIRETARLRLIPPCDVDDSGPIKDFLAEVAKLEQDKVVGAFSTIAPSDLRVDPPTTPSRWPCCIEECDPEGRPLFPVTPPWLHGDAEEAADPKVIVLAVLYAWLASEMARNGPNTAQTLKPPQSTLAASLYNAAWKAFYGTVPDTERHRVTEALQRLFQAWCRSFLYPGPKCECGCAPHGVVVGCASVSGGAIQMIDPWGGRRWVIHYPILSYWGKQLGIMPLDAIASKFFHLICCLSGLPVPQDGLPTPQDQGNDEEPPAAGPSVVNLGSSVLIFDAPSAVPGHLRGLGLQTAGPVTLSPIDFVRRVSDVLSGAPAAVGQPLAHYTVAGLREIHFIAPGAAVPAAPAPAEPAPAPGRTREGRLGGFVSSAVESRRGCPSVPPLLRGFAEDLARNLLVSLPLQSAVKARQPIIGRLAAAGVGTAGSLLDRDPEELLARIFGGKGGSVLSSVLESSEKTARAVARIVGDTVRTFAAERGVASRAELRDPAHQAELSQRLAGRLAETKSTFEPDQVAGAVRDAAEGHG